MKNQTAVEWLVEELEKHHTKIDIKNTVAFNQAKAMEKEQIVDAFDNGAEEWTPIEYSDGQHYYNHNFES
jgi:hypothetical protein